MQFQPSLPHDSGSFSSAFPRTCVLLREHHAVDLTSAAHRLIHTLLGGAAIDTIANSVVGGTEDAPGLLSTDPEVRALAHVKYA